MSRPFFSVIIVSLNAGKLIDSTIRSTLSQTFNDYEIIVKDGISKDDTLTYVPQNNHIRVYSESDVSLYDAMNQAVSYSCGRYLIFMNCGDVFASDDVLEKTHQTVVDGEYGMVYGDYRRDGIVRKQPNKLSGFYLYRTPLCHQSVFFFGDILRDQIKYDLRYGILADYDLEIYLFRNSNHIHVDSVICDYLGGGVSETGEGLKTRDRNRREIIRSRYTLAERIRYFICWKITLPKLRGLISSSKNKGISKRYYSIVNKINGK